MLETPAQNQGSEHAAFLSERGYKNSICQSREVIRKFGFPLRIFCCQKKKKSPLRKENGHMKFGVQFCNIYATRSPYTTSGAGSSLASSTMPTENMLKNQNYKTLKK